MKKVNIFWFRRDLRLQDNVGLYHALRGNLPVLPIFIFDTSILETIKNRNDKQVQFIYECVLDIKKKLNILNSDLHIYIGKPQEVWTELFKKFEINEIHCNEDYTPYTLDRDKQIAKIANQNNVQMYSYKDHVIFHPNEILKDNGSPYNVYTPYKNKWLTKFENIKIKEYSCNKFYKNFIKIKPQKLITIKDLGVETVILPNLPKLIKTQYINDYDKNRNYPAINATSRLSVHLRFGTISIRRCVNIAKNLNQTWLSELIWREFFIQILYHFPSVTHGSFKKKYSGIKWRNNKNEFVKWCKGETGYPIVDAGMRELNQTGFMHNRVRMITASFLVKDLLIDWRWGEKYFASKLLDFEQSSNNGNWQWIAGCGCDAAPYFRIFNPHTQLKKFDPEFIYTRKWVKEFGTNDYPSEIVNHKEAYHRCLLTYDQGINGKMTK